MPAPSQSTTAQSSSKIDRRLAAHPRQGLEAGRPHPRRAAGAGRPAQRRQGPRVRRTHHDVGGEAVNCTVSDMSGNGGTAPPSVLPTCPSRGGRLALAVTRPLANGQRWQKARGVEVPISPLRGRCPAGQRGATYSGPSFFRLRTEVTNHGASSCSSDKRGNARARMRKDMTEAELKLWNELRAHRLMDLLPPADAECRLHRRFCLSDRKLIVEIDGSQHGEAQLSKRDATKRLAGNPRLDRPPFLERRCLARHRQCLPAHRHRGWRNRCRDTAESPTETRP